MLKSIVKIKGRDDRVGVVEQVTFVPAKAENGEDTMAVQVMVMWMRQGQGALLPVDEPAPSFHFPEELRFQGLAGDEPGLVYEPNAIDDNEEEEEFVDEDPEELELADQGQQ